MPEKGNASQPTSKTPHQVRLPVFVGRDNVGLGDVIKSATYVAGIKPCDGCERRAQALNRWLAFTGRSK
ncbi:hypothetical protein DF111_32085 [Burkholderia stagnalis]|nr:hypothetical protein DF148_30100 [Burkholderia stagnalis]RQY48884.1 hypothetical protein DF111_32085 [Burkholderia stagnalis]